MDRTHPQQIPEGPEPHYDRVVSGYETFRHREPFTCEWGGVLPELSVAYETWGELSPARDNAVLLHTGLSASSHARSQSANPEPGWWEEFIGPGSAIDTDHFFVICTNLLGGCYGTTGPSSISRERAPVEGLDVLEDLLDAESGAVHLPGGDAEEHERVVGVGTVPHARTPPLDCRHTALLYLSLTRPAGL